MDRCPHCGRAVRPDAEACAYCGSDFETGWNPDADYYSFELPSEEDVFPAREPGPSARGGVWDTVIGSGAVVLAALCFLWVLGSRTLDQRSTQVAIFLLVTSFWCFLVQTRGGDWQES